MNVVRRQLAANSQTKPVDVSPPVDCYSPHPPSPFITTRPEGWYSFYIGSPVPALSPPKASAGPSSPTSASAASVHEASSARSGEQIVVRAALHMIIRVSVRPSDASYERERNDWINTTFYYITNGVPIPDGRYIYDGFHPPSPLARRRPHSDRCQSAKRLQATRPCYTVVTLQWMAARQK